MLDDLNKKTLQDTLFDFYEYMDRKIRRRKRKAPEYGGLQNLYLVLLKNWVWP